jgi:arsenate reductase (thioredoxin)
MPSVLILCTGNSARSQMAEGLFRYLAASRSGPQWEVHSAGTHPSLVRPEAVAVMQEIGIDLSAHWSKSVNEFQGREFDYVITVCDNAAAACPVFPGNTRRLHWPFEDPAAAPGDWSARLQSFRVVRGQIGARISEFLHQLS